MEGSFISISPTETHGGIVRPIGEAAGRIRRSGIQALAELDLKTESYRSLRRLESIPGDESRPNEPTDLATGSPESWKMKQG
jgi:hypothetical protein